MRSFVRPLALLAMLCGIPSGHNQAETVAEHELKAIFLYNFANYIAWPESAFKKRQSPFNYCLLGESRINTSLKTVAANETVKGRALRVLELDDTEQLSDCHILFVHQRQDGYPSGLMRQLAAESVLTVGDGEAFIPSGGTIGLLKKERRIDLLINMEAIELGQLKVSSKLLRLAKRVRLSRETPEP
ncbi:MAG: YfiR family protein [Candidatus Thiodiazotropha sp. (ex Dulcina madagascariensis)]|nr:YfiR family protein [Candidatus Thiodiazotropha sp. (ex Dulcina madagascariensis)]